jgi:putative flippase GtrA
MRKFQKQAGVKYIQFSLVGVSNVLVDVGVFNLFLFFGPTRSPGFLVAYNIAALILANANSYLWNILWTFRRQARHDARQVGMFSVQAAVNVGTSNLLLWGLANGLMASTSLSPQISGNVAKIASMVVASTVSFLLLRLLVFRPEEA